MNLINKIIGLSVLSLLVFSCSYQSSVKKKVTAEVKQEEALDSSEIANVAKESIINSATLTDDQKNKLLILHSSSLKEMQDLNVLMNKNKILLIKKLTESKYNYKEIDVLKNEIRKIGRKQISLTISSIENAREVISPIVGKAEREKLYNALMLRESRPY